METHLRHSAHDRGCFLLCVFLGVGTNSSGVADVGKEESNVLRARLEARASVLTSVRDLVGVCLCSVPSVSMLSVLEIDVCVQACAA